MSDESRRLDRLREAEARLEAAADDDDDVGRRLAALRHDIELALADLDRTIESTRRARGPEEDLPDEP